MKKQEESKRSCKYSGLIVLAKASDKEGKCTNYTDQDRPYYVPIPKVQMPFVADEIIQIFVCL